MQMKLLYKYESGDSVIISPVKPEDNSPYEQSSTRLIADEGKLLTKDGESKFTVIDVDNIEGWYEVEDLNHGIEEERERPVLFRK